MSNGDIKDAGALVSIQHYGIPWHGRIESGTLYTGKLDSLSAEVTRAWAQPAGGDCYFVKKPDLADPYAGADGVARKAAHALNGHELTNWALIGGAGDVHGVHFIRTPEQSQRWIWFDAAGEAFSVVFGLNGGTLTLGPVSPLFDDETRAQDWSFAADINARFSIKRFGDLRIDGPPAPTVTRDLTLAAGTIGQNTPALSGISGGNMIVRAITPTGDRAIMEIHSQIWDQYRGRAQSTSLGFVEFTLSGTGASPSVAMAVLADRATTIGSGTLTNYVHRTLSWTTSIDYTKNFTGNDKRSVVDRIVGYYYDATLAAVPVVYANDDEVSTTSTTTSYSTSTPSGPAQTYSFHEVSNETITGAITIGTASLTASGSNLNTVIDDNGVIDPSAGNTCAWQRDRTYTAPGMTTTTAADSDSVCRNYVLLAGEMDPGYDLDYEDTSVIALDDDYCFQSTYPQFGWCQLYRYSSHLFSIVTLHMLSTDGFRTSQGCIGNGILDATLRDFAAASHGSYNPATSVLAFPKTAPTNFT